MRHVHHAAAAGQQVSVMLPCCIVLCCQCGSVLLKINVRRVTTSMCVNDTGTIVIATAFSSRQVTVYSLDIIKLSF